MKIVMMGSGGVGGYFGARLAAGGADVHFVARGAHLDAMRSQGLTIEGGPAPLHLPHVHATNDPSSIGIADFVLIGVKLWDTADAIEQVKPIVGPRHDGDLLPERRLERPLSDRRVRRAAHHGRRRLCRDHDRSARRDPADGPDAALVVRRARWQILRARTAPSRRLLEGRYRGAVEPGHTARDLAEICVPRRPLGHHDHDPQAHRTDP